MSAECYICGHDLSPEGIGLAPCYFCEMRKALESAENYLESVDDYSGNYPFYSRTLETVRNALRRNE